MNNSIIRDYWMKVYAFEDDNVNQGFKDTS